MLSSLSQPEHGPASPKLTQWPLSDGAGQKPGRTGLSEPHFRGESQGLDAGGDPWALDNLVTLCLRCHIAHHQQDQPPDLPGVAAWRRLVEDLL